MIHKKLQNNNFGKLIRYYRLDSGKSLQKVSDYLGITPSYLSDVGRGARVPFRSNNLINKLANLFEVNPVNLQVVAALGRGVFTFSLKDKSKLACEVGALLMSKWNYLKEEDLDRLLRLLRGIEGV